MARRLLRRDVDGAIHRSRAGDPAPGRRARWLELQEVRSSVSGGRQQWRSTGGSSRPLRDEGTAPGSTQGCVAAGWKIAGAWAPKGSPKGGKPPRGELTGSPWLRSRCPRTRRTLAGIGPRGWRRWSS
jgi:hypothetical protein